jgi:RNA-directed DNA polymerase
MNMRGGWIIELDIRSFFESVDHGQLRGILDQRVRDGVIRRTIDKWLKAGVQHQGVVRHRDSGTPQGGVISPLLANVYLHEVLDGWFEREIRSRLRGPAHLVRYADDAVLVFAQEADARRVMNVLAKRFARYGLTLHPEKTKLFDFRRPHYRGSNAGSFDLLGFTHYWGRSRSGNWVLQRKTSRSRFGRALQRVAEWCRKVRHLAVREQYQGLASRLRGHYNYFGIAGNSRALVRFLREVTRVWRKWLDRRSNRSRMNWQRFNLLLKQYRLPAAHVVHGIQRP